MELIESVQESLLLQRLLNFIEDEGNQECILKVTYDRSDVSEGDLSATLANHLFSKLALNERYTLNKSYERWNNCPCGCNEKIQQYGDTSFGNESVWHGFADILVNESSVAVRNLEVCHDSPERASVGVKKGFKIVKKRVHNQLASQTVCFSFLQRHRHSEYQNTLIPCIGISSSEVMIYLYDSVKDVFVQSCVLSLFEDDKRQICISTVIAIWLAVNYKIFSSFCSSISDFVQTMPHANFFEMAKDKLHIYLNKLKFGSIGNPPAPKLFRRGGPKQISHLKGSEKMRLLGITTE